MILCAAALAALFVTGGLKRNPGPVENTVQDLCSGCDRNLKSGTECESCGIGYHNSSGNVKIQTATDVDLRDSEFWKRSSVFILCVAVFLCVIVLFIVTYCSVFFFLLYMYCFLFDCLYCTFRTAIGC